MPGSNGKSALTGARLPRYLRRIMALTEINTSNVIGPLPNQLQQREL